ncbi:MAG: DUF5702 domain-containing protein [Lachnospiraceae bacterium]|nr:DUF5702 domain-containing protein [Lachnospiraceae bacterium]
MKIRNAENGSVTVFLALILLVVFSLIMTSLEAAKSAASRAYAEMLLTCAAESEAADFYRPLFDEYHLFAIDTGFGESTAKLSEVTSAIEARIPPNTWGIENEGTTLLSYEMLADGSGDIFSEQAAKYEIISKAGDLVSGLAEKLGVMSKQEKSAKVLQKKLEAEEKVARIDELTIELMKIIDGVNCNISGDGKARYTIETNFVKRFLITEPSMSTVRINNAEVFTALSGKYINPVKMLDSLYPLVLEYAGKLEILEDSEAELQKLNNLKTFKEAELTVANEALTAVNLLMEAQLAAAEAEFAEKNKGRENDGTDPGLENRKNEIRDSFQEEISACQSAVTGLEHEIAENDALIEQEEKKLEKYREDARKSYKGVSESARLIAGFFSAAESKVREALAGVVKIKVAQAQAEPKIDEYGQTLNGSRPDLSEEEITEYEEAYDLMEEYISKTSAESAFDYETAEVSLRADNKLLEECDYVRVLIFDQMDSKSAREQAQSIIRLRDKITEFTYEGFVFDYSAFSSASNNEESGVSHDLVGALNDGFLGMLLKDPSGVSQAEIPTALLPSRSDTAEGMSVSSGSAQMPEAEDDMAGAGAMAGSIEGSEISDISDLSDEIAGSGEIDAGDDSAVNTRLSGLLKKAGMILYLCDNFGSYTDQTVTDDTVLKYEQEYIICGNETDKENLSSVLLRILLMRLVTSGVYVFCDAGLKAEAQAIATAAVGFTGMPFLIALMKYLILFILAYEQAMIETAALVMGKRISVITEKSTFMLKIYEVVLCTPGHIQKKAEEYPEKSFGVSYGDYLAIMLFLTGQKNASYRAMDLIQENIRYEYNEDFFIVNCITGFRVKARFVVPPKYIAFGGYRTSAEYALRY